MLSLAMHGDAADSMHGLRYMLHSMDASGCSVMKCARGVDTPRIPLNCCGMHAGSLTNLAKAPASTVQILGAEKALFRALKTKGNTPKYGLIFHSTFIGRAKQRNKGRISRYLANKCSIATRIDAFMDQATSVFGEKMRDQVFFPFD
jgi:hypothetical protein